MILEPQLQQLLIEKSVAARDRAYAPYSKFQVGAAVLAEDGTIVSGANVENASFGLSLCAERVAAAGAVAAGHQNLAAIAIATCGAAAPCGACRQFLAEFGPEMVVLLVDADGPENVRETTLKNLLPEQFHLDSMR